MGRRWFRLTGAVALTLLVALAAGLSLMHPGSGRRADAAPQTVTVNVGNNWFCDASNQGDALTTFCKTTINVDDTVEWVRVAGTHNVAECGATWGDWNGSDTCDPAAWRSPGFLNGTTTTFSRQFTTPGTFYYLCELHGLEMKGEINVVAAATATNTSVPPTATPTNTGAPPTATPTNTGAPSDDTATPTTTSIPATATPTNTGIAATATPTNTHVPPTATVAPPTATPTPSGRPGDANCDGLVDSRDALVVLQLSAGLTDVLPCVQNADANGDGQINALDAAVILQYDAGLIHSLPAGGAAPSAGRQRGRFANLL